MIKEGTLYFTFNNLKTRSKKSHRTERNLSRKERGLSLLTESKVPTAIINLFLSFVLSDCLINLIDCKLKTAIIHCGIRTKNENINMN